MKNSVIITVIAVVLAAGVAFFGGMKYQESKSMGGSQSSINGRAFGNRQGGQGARFTPGGQNAAGRGVIGDILSVDDKSLTVKMMDGSTKIVLLPQTIMITKSDMGTVTDLKAGARVAVFGSTNSDGSVTAQSIQLNPTFGMGGGNRMPNQAQKSADAREIVVEGSNYKFSTSLITIKKGEKIRILFKNTEGMHDIRVDQLNLGTAVIQGGQQDFFEFTADKTGDFDFFCSVANHREMGMKGILRVS